MAQHQKQKDPEFWFLHKRNGQVSSATLATIRGQSVSSGSTLVHNTAGHSLGPGGRRLKTVDAGSRGLFDEDDEEGVDGEMKRKRERELGQEGDIDEMEYEEDFADDDEKPEQEAIDDEETKEIEVRLCAFRDMAETNCRYLYMSIDAQLYLFVFLGTSQTRVSECEQDSRRLHR